MGVSELHSPQAPKPEEPAIHADVKRQLLQAVAGLQYGSVEVIVHDSRVVQIEVREKIRFGGSKARF